MEKELRCPKCNSVFKVDEDAYAAIVSQVKNSEFRREVESRMNELRRQLAAEHETADLKVRQEYIAKLNAKEIELTKKDADLRNKLSEKESEMHQKLREQESETNLRISELRMKISQNDNDKKLALLEEKNRAEKLIREHETALEKAKTALELAKKESELEIRSVKEEYNAVVKRLSEERDYYKDMKARMSTKMIGESLEIHCSTIFNRVRVNMYPNAYFAKDNDASGGTKGDFIFRDFVDFNGVREEYISIMFEMKNEMDTTATKHRNEDFFAKLDKDRREKGCEYAVLVSLLEPDSELYNDGIVDVSYCYDKMYVIRPQFFMAIISLLSTASRKSIEYKKKLEEAKQQSVDVTNFESSLNMFKENFSRHYELASRKFNDAIQEIDKTIKGLEKIKANLLSSENNLRLANQDTDKLTIKKLTRGNKTMKEKFEEARKLNEREDIEGN